ncbi:MAG: arginine--tRNA ligase [bacterium]|nr:arginine--tRNA ligase [bacterium]
MFRSKIAPLITRAIVELQRERILPSFDVPPFSVSAPEDGSHGDYATNAALIIAKAVGRAPMEVAELIAARLKAYPASSGTEVMAAVEAAAPGFVNITLSDQLLSGALASALAGPDNWWKSDIGKGKTVRVEYFQLNIAKRPHVGHLRSAVIGDAVKRMLLAFGYDAKSDTHVGDWGTQFGILLHAYKQKLKSDPGFQERITDDPFGELQKLYIDVHKDIGVFTPAAGQDLPVISAKYADLVNAGKEEFAKLERGSPENLGIWGWMLQISLEKLEVSIHRLGLLPFDMHRGESFYEDKMAPIAELALQKGVAKKTTDGAVVVDLAADGLDEAVLLKSDGASTYLLRDLATLRYMKETLNFSENLYVVDIRQAHHFRQLFRVAELLGFEGVNESKHVEFGFMTSPEGALSTRKGTAISLDEVMNEARDRALMVIREKNPDLANPEAVAEMVGLGALKYFDLSHHRRSDYVFQWDNALAFEGATGPYLQYTHARLKSILCKYGKEIEKWENKRLELDAVEHRLLAAMLRLPEAIEDALKGYAPNVIANYLHALAQFANEFYHSHPVMQEPDAAKRELRLAIVAGVADTLKSGLYILGITAPEEM